MHFKKIRFRTFIFNLTAVLFVALLFTPSLLFYTGKSDSPGILSGRNCPLSETGDAELPLPEKEISEDNLDIIAGELLSRQTEKNPVLPTCSAQVFLIRGIFLDQHLPPPKTRVSPLPSLFYQGMV